MALSNWVKTFGNKIRPWFEQAWPRVKQSWQQVDQWWQLPWLRYSILGLAAILVLFPGFVRDHIDTLRENLPGGNEGAIVLETPQLFTRGRLVNDRATESAWLTEQLNRTNDLLKDDRFASADFVRFARRRLSAEMNSGTATTTAAAALTTPPSEEADKVAKRIADLGLRAQPLDQFEDAVRYRAGIRSALMSTALDDRHDIDGNTVYRFNFNVAVVPPKGSNLLAVVNVELLESERSAQRVNDYIEVLHDWKQKLQDQVRRLVDDRASAIDNGLELGAEENKKFQEWLADEIDAGLAKLGISRPGVVESFNRSYQQMELDNQRGYVASRFDLIGAQKVYAGPRATDVLDSVIELCKITGRWNLSYYISDKKKRQEIEKENGEMLRCPVRQSPLRAAIDLLDILQFATESGAISSSCKDRSRVVPLLTAAAIPTYVKPGASDCVKAGLNILRDRQAAGLPKRRNDIVAKSVKATVMDEKRPKSNVELQLDTFFEIQLPSPCAGNCLPVVRFKDGSLDTYARRLIKELGGRMSVFTYAVAPNKTVQRSEVAQRNMGELSGAGKLFGAIPTSASASSDSESLGAEKDPVVIGFGDWGERNQALDQTKFGWAMFPRIINGQGAKRQIAENHSVSALISIPGWWKSVHMKVRTCWIAQSALSEGHRCPSNAPHQYQFTVRLPGDAADLMQNLRFEVITFPNLDQRQPLEAEVEVGRSASIIIRGGRLWRSPMVRLGGQEADKVEVLPDMRGVIARFDCVVPGAGTPGSRRDPLDETDSPLVRTLQVFTSEGMTQLMPVTVRAFTARGGHRNGPADSGNGTKKVSSVSSDDGPAIDEPCWVAKQREQTDLYNLRMKRLFEGK